MNQEDKSFWKAWMGGAGVAAVALTILAVVLAGRRSSEISEKWSRHGVETVGEVVAVRKQTEFRSNRRRRWHEDVLLVKVEFDGMSAEIRRSVTLPVSQGEKIRVRYLRTDPTGTVGWARR